MAEDTPISEECEREHRELPDPQVRNRDSEPHSVTVTVTGRREDGPSETIFEETYDVEPEFPVTRVVRFDPDLETIERYDDFVATSSTDDGKTGTGNIYSTVVGSPLRFMLEVEIDPDGELQVMELHWDSDGGPDPDC